MRERRLWVILALACTLRLGVAAAWAPTPETDAADYRRLAVELAEGRGYVNEAGAPTAWRPPLYPAAMAVLFRAVGDRPGAVRAAQAVAGTAVVALVYAAASPALGTGGALVAAALSAVDLAGVFASSRLLSEVLFTFLLVLSSLLAARAAAATSPRAGWGWGGTTGVVVALGALTRGVFVLYPLALVPAWLWGRGSRRALVAALVGFVLALTPWTVRNVRMMGSAIPVATQGGITLYSGYAPVDGWIFGLLPDDEETRAAARLPEAEASRYMVGATLRRVTAEPGDLPRLTLLKAAFFWVPLDWEILPWYGAFNPTYAFILLWAAAGAFWALRDAGRRGLRLSWPLWLPVAYMFAMALVFYGSPRFRMPVEPLLAVGAAAGLTRLAGKAGRRRAVAWALGSAALMVVCAWAAGPAKAFLRGLVAR